MLDFESYMTYRAYATGEKTPKPKTTKKKSDSEASPKTKTTQATKGKRIKSLARGDKAAKKKQPAEPSIDKGLIMLSDVALTEAEQLKLVIERSKKQTHNSHAHGSGADEGTGEDDEDEVNVNENDDDNDNNDDDDDDADNQDDDDDEQTDSDNDEFKHVESTDDEEVQGVNIKGEAMDEAANNEEDEGNDLYRDLNINLEGRDVEMMDDQPNNVQITQVIEDTHVIITPVIPEGQQQSSFVSSGFVSHMLNPRPDTGIDSIFNTEATSLVDVLVTTIAEPPLVFATTLPLPPTPLITHMQQTPFPIPTTAQSTSLQDLPNFGSLFGFDHRLKTLETNFSEFKQTNQFAKAFSSVLGIFDAYLANKMHETVKTADQVKEQVKAQVSKILPKIEKLVNDQLESEVLIRLSNDAKTSYAIAANLPELELKKILIDKMEANKSIDRSDTQKNLYKALVDAYDTDKDILDAYGDAVTIKRRRDDADDDEEPSAGSNQGSKRRRAGKEP
ncbi:hypothetical protein Tco_1017220 [Tanacetum coccineum]|uniref:Uncharacterized protein n=1 Tax=Tanacetum coccineum TaxID=301880 RepID=A0ABQ5FR28_9ASTR